MTSGVSGITEFDEEFGEFLTILKWHNPFIKLKSTISTTAVVFLDTTTFKGKNLDVSHKRDIKVVLKETDSHAFIA